jgi:alpha-galactosidase
MTVTGPFNGPVAWKITFKPAPKSTGVSINQLKATQEAPAAPVVLIWKGSEPFYEISRDGTVISPGQYGDTYQDNDAPAGKAVTYTVKPIGSPENGQASASVTLTTKAFEAIPTPPLPAVSLTTLKPASTTIGYGALTSGKDIGGGPLVLSGKTYQDGIGLHAKSEVAYTCKPEWKHFVATTGLDDSQRGDPRASIVCSVTATDAAGKSTLLAKTPVLASGKTMEWNINALIPAGTEKIILSVDDAGDGISCDHSDWVNAGFTNH